jgi:hypothetical protein
VHLKVPHDTPFAWFSTLGFIAFAIEGWLATEAGFYIRRDQYA